MACARLLSLRDPDNKLSGPPRENAQDTNCGTPTGFDDGVLHTPDKSQNESSLKVIAEMQRATLGAKSKVPGKVAKMAEEEKRKLGQQPSYQACHCTKHEPALSMAPVPR